MHNKKYLLEESEVFCILPWIGFYMHTNGDVYPCCLADVNRPFGNINEHSLIEMFNSEHANTLRRALLLDKKVSYCDNCHIRNGFETDSVKDIFLSKFGNEIDVIDLTNNDGSVDNVNIHYADLRISNFCNLKCVMCEGRSSSSWAEDEQIIKEQPIVNHGIIEVVNKSSVYDTVTQILPTLTNLTLAGGEPLMVRDNYRILDILVENKKFDIELRYATNLTKLKNNKEKLFSKWSKFAKLDVAVSIDGLHERGEYIRKGLNYDNWLSNVRLLNENFPNNYSYHCAVSIFNVWHIPDMVVELYDLGLLPELGFTFDFVTYPEYQNCQILPNEYKAVMQLKYNNAIEQLTHVNSKTAKQLENIRDSLFACDLYNEYREIFIKKTHELDMIRDQDYLEVFPELKGIME